MAKHGNLVAPDVDLEGDATTGESGGVEIETGTSTDSEESGSETTGETTGGGECVMTECNGKVYACGDCIDNDGDDEIDSADANCWGPCQDNEAGFKTATSPAAPRASNLAIRSSAARTAPAGWSA